MAQPTPAQIKAGWDQIEDLFGRNNIAGLLDYVKSNPYYLNAKNPEWDNNTTLQMFVIDEQEGNVEKYLKLKPDLKQPVFDVGGTILMQVAELALEPNIAKMLIKADPETVNIANGAGQVPLMFAIQSENEYFVYDLVKNGAKKDVKDSSGNDVWSYFNGDADSRKVLEDAMNGINPDEDEEPLSARELEEHQAFFESILSGNVEEVRAGLNRHPTWANLEKDGREPIDAAIASITFAVVKLLVESGAVVTEETVRYARYNTDDRVGLTDEQEDNAVTILQFLASRIDDNQSVAPSTIAAEEDDEPLTAEELTAQKDLFKYIVLGDRLQLVKDILTRHPKLTNLKYDDETPLEAAVSDHDFEMVKWMVEHGAIVTETAVEFAQEMVQEEDADEEERAIANDILRYVSEARAPGGQAAAAEEPLSARELEEQKVLFDEIDGESSREVRSILTRYPRLLNREFDADDDGMMESPLRRAVNTQNINLIRLLVELEADVTPQILQYQREIVDDARPGERAAPTAILRLLEGEEEEEVELTIGELTQQRALNDAINAGDVEKVREILARFPRLVNIEYNLNTPLRRAIYMVNIDIVTALLSAGATVDEDDLEAGHISMEDVDRMGGDTTTIQNIIELLENPPPVAPRALDFGDEPAMPTLEVTEIEYKELPDVFDMTLNKDIPIFDALAKRRIIFTVDDSYYGIFLGSIESSLTNKTSTFYECKKELDGSPYTKDVHIDTPYFRLTLNGNFTITEEHLRSALSSECSIFELVPNEKKLAFGTSYRSVQVSPGINGLGEDVNIVSADHCQKGSDQFTYDVKAVTMVKYRTAEQKEADRIEAEKKAVEDAAVAERMKQEAIVRKKAQEEQAAKIAARGSGRRRTYRKGKKTTKRKTYRKESNGRRR